MNVLSIVCDTTRVDHLSCYGYFRNTSPNIDEIARHGVVFEDFYNAGAPTGPGFTCMYTGLHTIRHKYYQFIQPNIRQVDDLIFTLPEILSAWGYTTAAVDNLVDFPPHSKHWVRGYDFYINPNPKAFLRPPLLVAEEANNRILPWIKSHADEDFFLFVHYWDPHLPYNQPREYREVFNHEKGSLSDLMVVDAPAGYQYVPGWGKVGEFADGEVDFRGKKVSIDLYDGEIRYMDDAVGEVISALKDSGIFEDTLLVITSDHGEHLGQHYDMFWAHNSLHDTITHIPLIMRYPKKLPRGIRVKGFGQHIDLLSTILDIIGAPKEALDLDGRSLLPLLSGEILRETLFMEHSSLQRAVRTWEWKLIDDIMRRSVELYNVKSDPLETTNLAETEKEKADELKETLHSWVKANLKEGEKDPISFEKVDHLDYYGGKPLTTTSRMQIMYRERISRLSSSFAKAMIPKEKE